MERHYTKFTKRLIVRREKVLTRLVKIERIGRKAGVSKCNWLMTHLLTIWLFAGPSVSYWSCKER
jgi:hypothetical protein